MTMEIDFMDAINGGTKNVNYVRTDICVTCKGSKCKPGTSASNCGGCGGTGFQTVRQGPFTLQVMCANCEGSGQVIRNPCM